MGSIPECDRSTNKDKRHPASPGGVCLCCIDSSGIKSPSGTDGGISRGFDDYSRRRRIGRRLPATPRPAREDGVSQSIALRRLSGWRLPAPPRPARAIPPASTNTEVVPRSWTVLGIYSWLCGAEPPRRAVPGRNKADMASGRPMPPKARGPLRRSIRGYPFLSFLFLRVRIHCGLSVFLAARASKNFRK